MSGLNAMLMPEFGAGGSLKTGSSDLLGVSGHLTGQAAGAGAFVGNATEIAAPLVAASIPLNGANNVANGSYQDRAQSALSQSQPASSAGSSGGGGGGGGGGTGSTGFLGIF